MSDKSDSLSKPDSHMVELLQSGVSSAPALDNLEINDTTLPVIFQLVELIPGGFFVYHADGEQRLLYFNSFMPSLFGCKNDEEFMEYVGGSFKGIVHPDDYEEIECSIREQIANDNNKVDHVRYRFIRKDGSIGMMDDYGHFSHSESFGDIFYVFVQDITEQYREEQEHKENIVRIMALEDNFGSLYDVDLETGHYVNYANNHLLTDGQINAMVNYGDFFGDTVKNADLVIYPDDREGLIKVLNREFVQKTLETNNYFDWYYRLLMENGTKWARLRFVYKDKEKTHIIVGAFNAEEEMAVKKRDEQIRKELIANIAGTESTYIVSLADESFTVISQNEHLEKNYPSDETFSESIARYIETDVYELDREAAFEALSLQSLVSHLEDEKEYVARFRDISTGNPRWFEMRAAKLSETEILFGFSDKNAEILGQKLLDKLKESYFGLCYVNLDLGRAYILKTGHPDLTGEAETYVDYSTLLNNIALASAGGAADFLNKISNIDRVKKLFFTEDVGYYSYKSHIFEGDAWVQATGLVLARHDDGAPSLFALGFALLDEDSRKKEEAQIQLLETTKMLEAENHHNTVLHQIIKSGPWLFSFGKNGEIGDAKFSEECIAALQNDVEDGIQWLNIIHPDDAERVTLAFKTCISDLDCKTPFDAEYRVQTRRGDYHWIHSAGRMKWNQDGTGEFYGICIDIDETVQKREEEQLRLKEALAIAAEEKIRNEMLRDIIHSGKWTFYVNEDDEVTGSDVSIEANSIIRNDVAPDGYSWLDIVHPDDREAASEAFSAAIKDHSCKTPYDVNYRMVGLDGEYRWFHSAGRMKRNPDGNGEFYGIHVDINDQMEEQQKRLLGAIPISPDILTKANIGLWAFELDEGKPPRMYGDEAMIKLVGLDSQVPPEEMYHAWYDHIDEGSYGLVAEAVDKMMTAHAEVQYPWHHPDGHTMIVRCGGVRNLEYTKGVRIEGTHQDVSETIHFDEEEQKRQEQQRKDEIARIAAESANKAKTEFLFNMSHDIRTPMNAILGYTDIALNHVDEPIRVGDSLEKIKMSGGHLLNLINDILEMSRIEAGKIEIANAPVNVFEVTEGVKAMGQSLASAKGITFNAVIEEMQNPYAYADELHTNQVIINLVSNAIKYTDPGGTVDYHIKQLGAPINGIAKYRITVKDNGIGMTEEFQKHLFESFSREDSADVAKREGTGLGLAIVKRIIDIVGGTISVQSKKGVGSTFVVEMPFEVMDNAAIEQYEVERVGSTISFDAACLNGKRALLVEDNELNREIAVDILEEAGLEVEAAEDGSVAVKTVSEKGLDYYDFILMDIQMPVMNGYEATRAIREMYPGARLPIIALSANAFAEDKAKSLAAGMDDHVAKPIDINELFSALAKFL